MALTWAILGGTVASAQTIVVSDSKPPEKKKTGQPVAALPAKLEARLKEFIDKAKVEKSKSLDTRMTKEIADITKVTGLDDAGQQALAAPAKQAIEVCVTDWAGKLSDAIRNEIALQAPDQAALMLDQMQSQIVMIVQGELPFGTLQPTDQDDWVKAVHSTLSPEQAAAWDKALTERKQDVEKQMGDILKALVERTRIQFQQEILSKGKDIELTLGLTLDRAGKIEDLAKTVTDQATETWRKKAEGMLLAMDETQRNQILKNGNFFVGTEPADLPSQQAAWKDGLAHLLTTDEVKHLQTVSDDRKNKRTHVMGQVMIMMMDEKAAFTTTQRQQLQPITDRLVKDVTALYPEGGFGTYFSYSPGIFLSTGVNATDAELKPILDDLQLKHWRQAAHPEDAETTPPDTKAKPDEHLEPEDVERIISEFLDEKTTDQRNRLLATNLLKVEDVVRAAGLNSETVIRLQAATRGTTEESLTRWKWFIEQQVRSQLQDVTPENIRQRLDSIQDYFFQQNFEAQDNGLSLWDKTVKTALTAKQQEAWQKETDAREAFREQAIAALIMAEFDRRISLTPDQWNKLQPLVIGVVHDYSPDISRIFSPNNPVPWYLESFYGLMPLMGIPDKDLQAILSKDQWDIWSKSQEHGNAVNFWQNVKQFHDQRVKTK